MDLEKTITRLSKPDALVLSNDDAATLINSESAPVIAEGTFANERTLYAELGMTVAESILQKISAVPSLARVYGWLKPEAQGLDVGHPQTRAVLDSLAGTVLTAEEVAALKAMAERAPEQITAAEIGYARYVMEERANG